MRKENYSTAMFTCKVLKEEIKDSIRMCEQLFLRSLGTQTEPLRRKCISSPIDVCNARGAAYALSASGH